MAVHILVMNVAAPAVAIGLAARIGTISPALLWIVNAVQLALLAGWHALSPHDGAHAVMLPPMMIWLAILGVTATSFWLAVFNNRSRWHPLAALMITGKIVCLGGALLIFAPGILHHGGDLADQQLAGLLMVTACPLSYLASALVLAVRAIEASGAYPARA